jgi:glycosyltransferase involved in cell wall biosynthesis
MIRGSSPPPLERQHEAPRSLRALALFTVGELFGGVERHVLALLTGLRTLRLESNLLVFHDAELAHQARSAGFAVDVVPASNFALLPAARQVASILRARGVQLLHVHGYKATFVSAVARLSYPLPIVKTEHGLPELGQAAAVQRMKTRLYHYADWLATRRSVHAICYVTGNLQAQSNVFLPHARAVVVPNGIARLNRTAFTRPTELAHQTFNLVLIGRLERVKGHKIAIDALASTRVPSHVRIYVIGTGPMESELRQHALAKGVYQRIHFVGFRRDVYNFLAHSDALLMPSLHEGLPYTMLESMALGCPVIASKVGGLAEVLRHDETALLVPPNDAAALAEAMERAVKNPGLLVNIARQAMLLQQSAYSLDAMSQRYLSVYKEALSRSSR